MLHPPLRTTRCELKNIGLEDTLFAFNHFKDPFVCKYLYDAEPFSDYKEAEEMIHYFTMDGPRMHHRYVLINANQEKMGTLGFHEYHKDSHSIFIGYDLSKAYIKQGYMTEALTELIRYIMTLRMDTVHACIYPENTDSIALVKRLGFEKTGEKTEWFRNEPYLHDIYSLSLKEKG